MSANDEKRLVVDQFTQQAAPFRGFAELPGHPRDVVVAATQIKPDDTVLDVACGPGVTTCDLAEVAQHGSTPPCSIVLIAGLAVWHNFNWRRSGKRSELFVTESKAAIVDSQRINLNHQRAEARAVLEYTQPNA